MGSGRSAAPLMAALGLLLVVPLLVIVIIVAVQEEAENACAPVGDDGTVLTGAPLKGDGFTVASINALGHSHTRSGGRARMGSGQSRTKSLLAYLRAKNVDVVGLQELQPQQRHVFAAQGTEFTVFPGTKGSRQSGANSIAWRTAAFELVEGRFVKIPYFGGKPWPMPVVILRNRTTGQQVVMMNVHNPADAHGPAGRWRDRAEQIERNTMRQMAARTGAPTILTGDFNAPLKSVQVGMKAAAAGNVDFIFTSGGVGVQDKRVDFSVKGRWTDHPAILAKLGAGETKSSVPEAESPAEPATKTTTQVAGLTVEQTRNAATIIQTGKQLGVPARGLVVALATALQESGLRNLDYGDRDSLGLFQQRPSTGWGTPAEIRDPVKATQGFFGRAAHTNNTGLLDIAGWEAMPITVAAQSTQRSAFPSAYADDEDLASKILAQLDSGAAANLAAATDTIDCGGTVPVSSGACSPTGLAAEKGLTPDAAMVLRCVEATFGSHTYGGVGERAANSRSDHPAGRAVDVMIPQWNSAAGIAEGDAIAAWLQQHHRELGITYLIWRGRIWAPGDSGWRPYSHPSGASDPTSRHMDHVHVSVKGNAGTGMTGDVVLPLPAGTYTDQNNWRSGGSSWASWHSGNDLSAPCGTPVFAVHPGTVVIDRTQSWSGPWLVKITQGPGQTTTWYAHMQSVSVQAGQQVRAGQQIGAVGDLGNSTGCHLHLELHTAGGSIYAADNTNPMPWIKSRVGRPSDTVPANN